VVLAATLRSEGSVSSPTVRIYPPGTELQVIGRVDGWYQVSDPLTQERGWIFGGEAPDLAAVLRERGFLEKSPDAGRPGLRSHQTQEN